MSEDCTASARAWHLRAATAAAAILLAACLLAGGTCPARADGDPASDVLVTQSLYLPQDAGASPGQQAQLSAAVALTQRDPRSIRVAIIASAADLGSVTELWRQPRLYARFLAQELGLVYHGLLIVVMPGGYGISAVGGAGGEGTPSLDSLPAPGENLAAGALSALRDVATAEGRPFSLPSRLAPPARGSSSPWPLLVFLAGLALLAASWAASIRVRPLRSPSARRPEDR